MGFLGAYDRTAQINKISRKRSFPDDTFTDIIQPNLVH